MAAAAVWTAAVARAGCWRSGSGLERTRGRDGRTSAGGTAAVETAAVETEAVETGAVETAAAELEAADVHPGVAGQERPDAGLAGQLAL